MELSIIIITKNQDWNITRLIQSVLNECSSYPQKEILLVDSASSDNTVNYASTYPITILRLSEEQRLTASAGRYTGYQYSSGKYLLFLDGDMELYPGWLSRAMNLLRSQPEIAVVSGQLIDLPLKSTNQDKPPIPKEAPGGMTDVAHGGGASLYKRTVLEQVGSFNPWIYSEEEPELCLRIRHAGFRVVKLQHVLAYHYSDPGDELKTLLNRWRRNLYLGYGQNLRIHFGKKTFWPYLRERGFGLPIAFILLTGMITLYPWISLGNSFWFFLLISSLAVLVAVWAAIKGSFKHVMCRLFERTLTLDGMVKGIFLHPVDPGSYPNNPEIIQTTDKENLTAEIQS